MVKYLMVIYIKSGSFDRERFFYYTFIMHIKNGCSVFFAVREQKFNLLRMYLLFLNENS